MAALAFDAEELRRCQSSQMATAGLRGNSGNAGQLGGRERSSVHEGGEHCRPRRLPEVRRDLGDLVAPNRHQVTPAWRE
jgi:hypothetical protein